MTEFNKCAQLVSSDELTQIKNKIRENMLQGVNPLQMCIDMQISLQNKLATEKPDLFPFPTQIETCGGLVDWIRKQYDYIDDEKRELLTALGGMSNGASAATAVWKPWKAKHKEMQAKKFADLSSDDILEAQFEMIDQFHFILNIFISLGMDAETIAAMYYLKNKENFARQERGY